MVDSEAARTARLALRAEQARRRVNLPEVHVRYVDGRTGVDQHGEPVESLTALRGQPVHWDEERRQFLHDDTGKIVPHGADTPPDVPK